MLGNSPDILKGLLPALSEHIVFWLDAHFDFAARGKGKNIAEVQPIIQELEAIRDYSKYNKHTILIDDYLDFIHKVPQFHSISDDDLKYKILEINRDYTFRTIKGADEDSILVAEIPEFIQ